MAAPAAPAPAAPVLPPTAFLMALKNNVNVSAACVAGVDALLLDPERAKQASFFSGKVQEGLNLLLPPVFRDVVMATDKRQGLADLIYTPPLTSLGQPDSCGYLPGMQYCHIDVIPVFVKWGVCVPASCTIQDVTTAIFPPITERLAARTTGVCGPINRGAALLIPPESMSPAAIGTLAFVALLLLMTAAATVADVTDQYGNDWNIPFLNDDRSWGVSLARCFSLRRNYERLMAPPRVGPFLCLDAVRVLAMCQILLGHSLWFVIHVQGIANPREFLGFHDRGFGSTGVGLLANSSLYGVDAFFLIAGFFAVLLFMKELEKRFARTHGLGRRTALVGQMAIYTWVRRYLRLTPAFAVVLAVFTTLAGYLESSAPSPTGLGHQVALCQEKWWQNILYVNNILSNSYDMCYIPSWWLAVIQQLFLIVPFIAAVAHWRPNAGLALCLLACVASWAYSFETAQRENWRINSIDRPGFPNWFNHFYIMPFTRLPTFVLGCVGAILWHRHGDAFTRYMNSGRAALKAWGTVAVALVVLGLVEWGPHRELAYVPGKWTQTESSLYVTFAMSGWVLGLALVCAVLFAGQGGPLKRLLELPFWSVAARLTFATYLVHPMVIWVILGNRGGQPYHFTVVSIASDFVGFSTMSLVAAVAFFFVVEGPFGELERWAFKGRERAKTTTGKELDAAVGDEGMSKAEKPSELLMAVSVSSLGSSEDGGEATTGAGITAATVVQQ